MTPPALVPLPVAPSLPADALVAARLESACSSRVDFPIPGIAADQHHAAGDQAATEHAVELVETGGLAGFFAGFERGQGLQPAGLAGERGEAAARSRRCGLEHGFDKGVPGLALRALALPAHGLRTAFGADESGFLPCHQGLP